MKSFAFILLLSVAALSWSGSRERWALSRNTPCRGHQSITRHHIHTFTSRDAQFFCIHSPYMLVFGWGEETHVDKERTYETQRQTATWANQVSHNLNINKILPGRPKLVLENKPKPITSWSTGRYQNKIGLNLEISQRLKRQTFPVDFTPFQMQK